MNPDRHPPQNMELWSRTYTHLPNTLDDYNYRLERVSDVLKASTPDIPLRSICLQMGDAYEKFRAYGGVALRRGNCAFFGLLQWQRTSGLGSLYNARKFHICLRERIPAELVPKNRGICLVVTSIHK